MRRKAFVADTTALILFFTTTGIINERWIAGMSWEQILHARLIGAMLMLRFATSPLDISSLSSSESANRCRFRTGGR